MSHSHAPVFGGFLFLCKVKLVVQLSFRTAELLVSHIAVSISCECYEAEASQTAGGARDPVTLHACTQTE